MAARRGAPHPAGGRRNGSSAELLAPNLQRGERTGESALANSERRTGSFQAADPRPAHLGAARGRPNRAAGRRNPARFGRGGGGEVTRPSGEGRVLPGRAFLRSREREKKLGGSKRERRKLKGVKEKLDGRAPDLVRVDDGRLTVAVR